MTNRTLSLLSPVCIVLAIAGSTLAQSGDKPTGPATAPASVPIKIEPVAAPPGMPAGARPAMPAQPGQPAQPKPFELPARMQPPPPPPPFAKPAIPAHTATDSEVLAATAMLNGSFRVGSAGELPARVLHGSTIKVDGLDNAIYFELTREDSPMTSFRQGVWHIFKQTMPGGGPALVLRTFEFSRFAPGFNQAVTGLWLAPEYFPAVALDQLRPVQDIVLTPASGGFEGTSAITPTMTGGATMYRTNITLTQGNIRWQDTGFDAAGKQVFGAAADTYSTFKSPVGVRKNDENGLVVIDFREGPADQVASADGMDLFMHYTGWTAADGALFDSSREREPLKMSLPGTLIAGWNLGMPGIKQGGFRKLVIPGGLGYGTRGNPRAKIPPMATLIFDTECVLVKPSDAKPTPAAPPIPAPTSPATAPANPAAPTTAPITFQPQVNPADQPK